jgi:hypothetical protein
MLGCTLLMWNPTLTYGYADALPQYTRPECGKLPGWKKLMAVAGTGIGRMQGCVNAIHKRG